MSHSITGLSHLVPNRSTNGIIILNGEYIWVNFIFASEIYPGDEYKLLFSSL
jgi:hypothetical protein